MTINSSMIKQLKEDFDALWALPNLGTLLLFFCMFFVLLGIFSFTKNSDQINPNEFKKDEVSESIIFDKADVGAIYYNNRDGIAESVIYDSPIDIRISIEKIESEKLPINSISLYKRK